MIVVTTENIPGYRVVKGQCFGLVVRSRGIGGNLMAALRSIVGGEINRTLRSTGPGPDWSATTERFIDPETDRSVQVWYNPATGQRRHVTTMAMSRRG